MLLYSVYFEIKHQNGKHVYVKFGCKSDIGYRNFGK